MVKTDYQVYLIALTSFAAKQGKTELTKNALLLNLRVKVIQNEILEMLSNEENRNTLLAGARKTKKNLVKSLYKTERMSLLTYLKSLFTFFEVWTNHSTHSCQHDNTDRKGHGF